MTALRADAPWRHEVHQFVSWFAKDALVAVLEGEADNVRRETGLRPQALLDAVRQARLAPEMAAGMFLMAAARARVQAKLEKNLIAALEGQAERLTQILRARAGSSRQTAGHSLE